MSKEAIGFEHVYQQLKILNRLTAARLKTTMSQQDMVKLLMSTGASNADIADVLDTTPATVATTLQRIKKKAAAKPAETASSEETNG